MKKTILLDMDGVLVDLVPEVYKHFGKVYDPETYPGDTYCLTEALGMKHNIWNEFDYEFWADLPKTSYCDKIITRAVNLAGEYNVHICSYACTPDAAAGKLLWLEKHYGNLWSQRLIMTRNKWVLAQPGYILVDDRCHSCREFGDEGGESVIVPRPWNEMRAFHKSWGDVTLRGMYEVYHNAV